MSLSVSSKRIYLLITFMAVSAIAGASIYILYNVALEEARARLVETADSQAHLMEAMARFNRHYPASGYHGDPFTATLSQIKSAHDNFGGFGETGEFTLAKREGDEIIFLLSYRHDDETYRKPIAFADTKAEPMRRALQGKSGSMIGLDYRGATVLAAYEPVQDLGLGIVAKMDMAELRTPYLKAGGVVVGLAAALALLAAWLFSSITRPMLRTLEESERRFAATFSQAAIGLAHVGLDGSWLRVNQTLCDMVGYSSAELMTRTFQDITHPDDLEADLDFVRQVLSGEISSYAMEKRYFRKDGSILWVNLTVSLVRKASGEPDYFISAIEEISERKKTEEKVRKLSQAVEQSGEAVVITDLHARIEYVNPMFTELTGYSEADVLGRTPNLLKSGNQKADFYEKMWATLKAGEVWQGKVVNRKKNGTFYPAMLTISPIKDAAGEITSYIGLQQSLEQYEVLEAEFHQAQKMEALGTLVGGIAHDFNNLLAGITGNLYLAKKRAHANPEVEAKLAIVQGLANQAADLIKRLLTFARKGMVEMEDFPLAPFIKETLKLLRSSVPENIDIIQKISGDLLTVHGDATQLHQALLNLVNNACDALEGVAAPTIKIALEPFYADAAFVGEHNGFTVGRYAHLSVEDNGSGIPRENIEHLFEPFFTTKPQGRGTGLGLAMVFGAVKTHNGVIEVKSSEGEGSIFHIYLPLLEEQVVAPVSQQAAQVIAGRGELILLVDDQLHVLAAGRGVLESLGYRVLEARDGLEAIDQFTAHQNDIALIMIDVVMPNLGGVEAIERIREIRPDAKAIFLTGYDMDEALAGSRASAEPSARHTVISKPYNVELLSRSIRTVLDG